MTLLDKLRFHNILTRAGLPEAPSTKFADALQDTSADRLSPLATKVDVERLGERIERFVLASEARHSRALLTWVAVILAAIAIATGLIIALT